MTDIASLYKLFLAHPIVTSDTRDCPKDSIFFALKGTSYNGNLFAKKALELGCAYVVVDDSSVIPAGDNRFLLVSDSLKAMQDLAHEHRKHFHGPVIEVTGTNGKTTTKELLTAVLSKKFKVLATEANYNNHIGVPKTLLRLELAKHEIAVVETGANHPGEIAFLANIVDPDCGLITNVGKAHLEGFGSFDGVIRTKGELYDYLRNKKGGFVFLDGDNEHLLKIVGGLQTVRYGTPNHSDYKVQGEALDCNPFLHLRWRVGQKGEWHDVKTHLIGAYNLQNALAAACVGRYFSVTENDITTAIEDYVPQNDRSELRITENNHLIVDAYNANPTSMQVALQNFSVMKGEHKMVILGDMRELGSASEEEHQKIVNLLQKGNYEEVWLVGENFCKTKATFRCFSNVDEVISVLKEKKVKGRLILIKGSNGTKLYELPELL